MMSDLDSISTMPQMGLAFAGWQNTITLTKLTEEVVNGDREVIENTQTYKGVVQPLSAEQVQLKPEGQRAWQWLQIHIVSNTNECVLRKGDKIVYKGVEYKIMGFLDYSLNNYLEYHVVKDYTA